MFKTIICAICPYMSHSGVFLLWKYAKRERQKHSEKQEAEREIRKLKRDGNEEGRKADVTRREKGKGDRQLGREGKTSHRTRQTGGVQ